MKYVDLGRIGVCFVRPVVTLRLSNGRKVKCSICVQTVGKYRRTNEGLMMKRLSWLRFDFNNYNIVFTL